MTVKFVLSRPDATILATFPMDFASIVSKEYADQLEAAGTKEQFNVQPVGTGPFTFVDYQQDAVIRYQAHPDWWNGKQPIDDLIFAITVDAGVRQQKLVAGECDIIPYPNPADIEGLKANADLTVMQQEGFNIGYLAYNTLVPPFDKPEVRRALNKAINKQAIIDAVFQGVGTAAVAPLPPTSWGYNPDLVDDPYDPEAAKAELEAAGVTGLSMKIWAMPVQRPYNPSARRMAELLQPTSTRWGSRPRSSRWSGASTWPSPRPRIATARCCSAGPATTPTRTTSSGCCSAATRSAPTTGRSGATSPTRT